MRYLTDNCFVCAAGEGNRMSGGTAAFSSLWVQLSFLFSSVLRLSFLLIIGSTDKPTQMMDSEWLLELVFVWIWLYTFFSPDPVLFIFYFFGDVDSSASQHLGQSLGVGHETSGNHRSLPAVHNIFISLIQNGCLLVSAQSGRSWDSACLYVCAPRKVCLYCFPVSDLCISPYWGRGWVCLLVSTLWDGRIVEGHSIKLKEGWGLER